MNTQVIAAIAGGLVIGGAAFIPMEVAAIQSGAPTAANGQVQDQDQNQQNGDTTGSADETLDNGIDGTAGAAGAGTAPAPISGPSFGSGDDDDDDHEDDDDDDHEDDDDNDDEDEDEDDD